MTQCGNRVDHCVQAVGVDASNGGYWKVRNSWGTYWADGGWFRLQRGTNALQIENSCHWAVPEPNDSYNRTAEEPLACATPTPVENEAAAWAGAEVVAAT